MTDNIAQWISAGAPGTITRQAVIQPCAPFNAAEAAAVANAVPKRQYEFYTGRALARAALRELGHQAGHIPADNDRVPIWPAGFTGSISHSDTLCIVQIGPDHTALGIDIEPNIPLDPTLIPTICRQDEDHSQALAIFTAKEAFYKATFPQTRTFLDFQDVQVSIEGDGFTAKLMNGETAAIGRISTLQGHQIAAVTII